MDGYSDNSNDSLAHNNLYLRPVPPGWDDARLSQFFAAFGDVDSVRISLPTPGSRAGVAHAFIRFREADAAKNALNTLQGTLLDGLPVVIKLADADMAPRIQSGLCASEWCYARGLPAHLSREDILAIFTAYGPVKDLKHFPSTEYYRGSGALVQYNLIEQSTAAIQALNGCLLPGATQPLLVRYADSPTEKAAKAARKERLAQRNGLPGPGGNPLALQEQIQQQLLELSIKASAGGAMPPGAGLMPGNMVAPSPFNDPAWFPAAGAGMSVPGVSRAHNGQGCSIYIKGMPEDADKLWLYEKFSRFGGILSVRVLLDEQTGRCNGIGFVNFTDPEGARAAHETMNGVSMGERLLHVMVQSHSGGRGGGGSSSSRSQSASNPSLNNNAGSVSANQSSLHGTGPFIPGLPQQSNDFANHGSW